MLSQDISPTNVDHGQEIDFEEYPSIEIDNESFAENKEEIRKKEASAKKTMFSFRFPEASISKSNNPYQRINDSEISLAMS